MLKPQQQKWIKLDRQQNLQYSILKPQQQKWMIKLDNKIYNTVYVTQVGGGLKK